MNRDKALAALDEALSDSVKGLFDKLVLMLIDDDQDAAAKFGRGLEKRLAAREVAAGEVERIFPA
jgi:ActR/RegA family two-component response regulator